MNSKPRTKLTIAASSFAICIAMCSFQSRANADAPPSAKDLYSSGKASYNLGHYGEALTAFESAYRVKQDPAFLFNIAQCFRNLNRYDDAARTYRAYLRETVNPTDTMREQVQKLIAEMDRAQAELLKKQQTPSASDASSTAATPPPQNSSASISATAPPKSAARRPFYKNAAAMTLTIGGLVLVGAGGAILGVALNDGATARKAATEAAFDSAHRSDIALQKAAWPILGVGAIAFASGSIMFALDSKHRR